MNIYDRNNQSSYIQSAIRVIQSGKSTKKNSSYQHFHAKNPIHREQCQPLQSVHQLLVLLSSSQRYQRVKDIQTADEIADGLLKQRRKLLIPPSHPQPERKPNQSPRADYANTRSNTTGHTTQLMYCPIPSFQTNSSQTVSHQTMQIPTVHHFLPAPLANNHLINSPIWYFFTVHDITYCTRISTSNWLEKPNASTPIDLCSLDSFIAIYQLILRRKPLHAKLKNRIILILQTLLQKQLPILQATFQQIKNSSNRTSLKTTQLSQLSITKFNSQSFQFFGHKTNQQNIQTKLRRKQKNVLQSRGIEKPYEVLSDLINAIAAIMEMNGNQKETKTNDSIWSKSNDSTWKLRTTLNRSKHITAWKPSLTSIFHPWSIHWNPLKSIPINWQCMVT